MKMQRNLNALDIDDNCSKIHQGLVSLVTENENEQNTAAMLHLTEDTIFIQKEEMVYTSSSSDCIDPDLLTKERHVTIFREKVGGLGLSIKGGAEHNLPVLVSRIFKDQAADKTGVLFVGDAISKVNDTVIETFSHDQAVQALKAAGNTVTLTVKYFRPASLFLNRYKRSEKDEDNNPQDIEDLKLERQWTTSITIPLLFAYVTSYIFGTDKYRGNEFEVIGSSGLSSGVIQCDEETTAHTWVQYIMHNVNLLCIHSISVGNKLILASEHVIHMSWGWEYLETADQWQQWKPIFITLKGPNISLYDKPPKKENDWNDCMYQEKVYECMFRLVKSSERRDRRPYCCLILSGDGKSKYICTESKQDLLKLERSWYQSNYLAVKYLGSKTFSCTWRGSCYGLILDFNSGFALYDNESKTFVWNYRFSQLKGSSDDGQRKIKLLFLLDKSNTIENQEIETSELHTLLYAMHAFLSAKLASVDPSFLTSLS